MTTLANENKVPHITKQQGLGKWEAILEVLQDDSMDDEDHAEGFIDWWHSDGESFCSFCRYFGRSQFSKANKCAHCPLHTGSSCADPWDKISVLMDTYLEAGDDDEVIQAIITGRITHITAFVKEMYEMIEAVPTLKT